ncbi:MAG: YceI family protein [Candidatus Acidiferrales bacterium]
MKKFAMAFGLAAILAVPAFAATTTWTLDPNHTNAQFTVRHLGISNVQGDFTKISGTVQTDDQDLANASVDITIDVNSIDTRVAMRDNDLKSEHFLNAAMYPTITFKSTKVEKSADGYKVTGNLTIRGVTKEVVLNVGALSDARKDPMSRTGGLRRGAAASLTINRQDFGVAADPGMVGDEVAIQLDCEMTAAAPAAQ